MSDEANNNNDNINTERLVTNKVTSKNGTVKVSASAVEAADDEDSFIEDAHSRNIPPEARCLHNEDFNFRSGLPNLARLEDVHMTYENYPNNNSVQANDDDADATLRSSDGYYFPVHRAVLCGESDYFK
ncbi:unnamed protein product [Orchesella dallaii]|uniref:BTB domain-containing protein n=1 Tax=Orchesella dallaii TaxID=48710 RepID=A0ABP1S5B1_9HEXA